MSEAETIVVESDGAIEQADRLLDDMADSHIRQLLRAGKARNDFAAVAADISRDRYGAGSTAVRAALVILLLRGLKAAEEFMADLSHHEDH